MSIWRKISLENKAYHLVLSLPLPSYAELTAFDRSLPLCLMPVSWEAGNVAAVSLRGVGTSRDGSWAGEVIRCHPLLQPLAQEQSQGELAGRDPNVLQPVTLADISPPGGLPASQRSVSRPGTGYETRKWLEATFVPPLVAPLLCPGVEDLRELGWKQRLLKNTWGREKHFRQ